MYLLLNHKQLLYKILPYGCQMNFSDGERFAGQLERMGYKPAEKLEDADIIIINTCCVRESAEKKIYGKIGEIKHLKQQKPDLILGIIKFVRFILKAHGEIHHQLSFFIIIGHFRSPSATYLTVSSR